MENQFYLYFNIQNGFKLLRWKSASLSRRLVAWFSDFQIDQMDRLDLKNFMK